MSKKTMSETGIVFDKHPVTGKQFSRLGGHVWSVSRLIDLSADLQVMSIPLQHLNISDTYSCLTLREMAAHVEAVNNSNLKYPIILDEDGEIMDGRHRLIKAILQGNKTIKAVRFQENPLPCETDS